MALKGLITGITGAVTILRKEKKPRNCEASWELLGSNQ